MNVGMSYVSNSSPRLTYFSYGFKCRFLGGHVQISECLALVQDENKKARNALTDREMNYTSAEVLKLLRSKKVSYSASIILVPLRGIFPSILSRSLTLIWRLLVSKQLRRPLRASIAADKRIKRETVVL